MAVLPSILWPSVYHHFTLEPSILCLYVFMDYIIIIKLSMAYSSSFSRVVKVPFCFLLVPHLLTWKMPSKDTGEVLVFSSVHSDSVSGV